MSYGRCKPVNPAFMRQGWYDTIAYITSVSTFNISPLFLDPNLEQASAGEDRTGGPARGDESPLTSCSTTPCMSPTIPDMVIPNSLGPLVGMRATPPPQHRTFMECVQIPSPRPFISLRADRNEVVPIAVSAEPPPTTLPGQPPGPLNCKRKRRVENQKVILLVHKFSVTSNLIAILSNRKPTKHVHPDKLTPRRQRTKRLPILITSTVSD